jgi:hypothetical protein
LEKPIRLQIGNTCSDQTSNLTRYALIWIHREEHWIDGRSVWEDFIFKLYG